MKKITPVFLSLIAVVALIPITAAAQAPVTCQDPSVFDQPTELAANGHYYQAIADLNGSWADARDAAALMMFTDPVSEIEYMGHLAIITTVAEDCFVEKLRAQSYVDEKAEEEEEWDARPEYWVGGLQDPATTTDDANWKWIIEEAPFDNYTNWQSGEPNDAGGGEMYLGIGHGNVPGWNDEKNVGNIGGHIVEFDVNAVVFEDEELDVCFSETGCPTTPGGAQIIAFPDSAFPDPEDPDPSLTAITYRLTDNPARCGNDPLVLFGGDLIISPNHCATPETGYEFIVVFTEATGIDLQEGTIRVVQNAILALPDFPYTCDAPIPPGVSANDQEIVIYQRTNKEDMREYGETWGPFIDVGDEAGATSDITDSCGSSRARRAENSYSVIGMVQHFDADSELYSDVNRLRWRQLAHFKLELLQEAILDSEPALSRKDFKQISKQASQALNKFGQANDQRAIAHLNNLLRKVERADYDSSETGNNDQGEAIERAASVRFIIATKIPASGQ
jgi:hypothetical protein